MSLARLLILSLVLAAPLAARADEAPPRPENALGAGVRPLVTAKKQKIEVELLPELAAVAPGETFRLALRFKTEPEWHLYWKNPGAIGLPTEITFDAPDGWDFGAISFPLPQRIVSKLGDVSYGYEGELVLMSEVRVPDGALEGSSVTLTAKAKWLICKENCIQGSAELTAQMPLAHTPRGERVVAENVKILDDWQGRIPLPLGDARAPKVKASSELEPAKPGEPFALRVELTGDGPLALGTDLMQAFFPATPDGLEVTGVEAVAPSAGAAPGASSVATLRIKGKAGPMAEPLVGALDGVFVVKVNGAPVAFDVRFDVPRKAGPAVMPAVGGDLGQAPAGAHSIASASVCEDVKGQIPAEAEGPLSSFLLALLFAFVGGIILNAMPCVLPVLSLKILSLVEQSKEDKAVIWRHGLVYTGGVLFSFLAMGLVLLAAQATGWAAQMQSPVFMAVFIAIVFGFALSLFGVFELALPFASRLDQTVASAHGYRSSFFYGMFAVLLGTPFSAPFLGPALAYAFTRPPVELLTLLLVVGLGLAFPFLLLARFPAWRRIVPRPGPWLETFKKVMGFLLIGTAVFFVNTLAAQVSKNAFVAYLEFLAVLAFGLFVYGHWTSPMRSTGTRITATLLAVGLVALGATTLVSTEPPPPPAGTRVEGGITWHEFDLLDVEKEALAGKTVFIDFTADWCTTCKVNEATAIYTDTVRRALSELNVLPVKGDFTVHKEPIARWLARFNQPSVPLYVIIPAGRPEAAFALPTLLSTDDIVGGLCRAGASTVQTALR